MGTRKRLANLLLGCSTVLIVTSAHSFEFFSANRYDELAALPSSSLGAPTGLVSGWGSAFVALGGLQRTSPSNTDGSLAVGMGLGDPIESIGSVVSLSIGSINTDGGAGERGGLAVSVGKFFVGPQLGIAIGGLNLASWSSKTKNPNKSLYFAVTKIIPIDDHPIIINAGVGSNAFSDVKNNNRKNDIGAFVSAGVYLSPHVSLIADYTSKVVTLGTSILPVSDFPLIVTLGVYDVNNQSPNSSGTTFIASLGYSLSF